MPELRAAEIAELVGGAVEGDADRVIRHVKPLSEAGGDDLSFLSNAKYLPQLESTGAGIVLVDRKIGGAGSATLIRVDDPYLALALVLQKWFAEIPGPRGISPRASVDHTAHLGADVSVGDFVTIGEDVVIGNRVTIFPGVVIGARTTIGEGTTIFPNVSIYHDTVIGARCIVHAGVVIGGDGFGFATSGGKHHKLPQIGRVRIGDDVEIGAGTCIDRAALGETVIGDGTKIDNLVQIAHNVKIGRHCLIVAQSGIAGSTELGDYCVLGGQAGLSGHLRIGSKVQVAAQSAVMKDFDGPATVGGTPARELRDHLKVQAALQRLPELLRRIRNIERKISPDHESGE